MKKLSFILICALLMLAQSFKPADEIKWLGFTEGYTLAKSKKKIMLIDVYTDWCGWCKRMDKDAYQHSEVIGLVNKDFVAVKFNPEVNAEYTYNGKKYNGRELAGVISDNSLTGYPTTVFINPKNEKKKIFSGYRNADQMKNELAAAQSELTAKK